MEAKITSYLKEETTVTTNKRIYIIDSLRGFSLLGIIIAHTTTAFLLLTDAPTAYNNSGNMSLLDSATKMFVQVFISGKFYVIFSTLFGLSFAIQMQNAELKKQSFKLRFLWRLTLLFFIGYLHSFIFEGGILQDYALIGLALLLFSNIKNENTLLLFSSLIFIINLIIVLLKPQLSPIVNEAALSAESSIIGHLLDYNKIGFSFLYGRILSILSFFILGLYIGKKKLVQILLNNNTYSIKLIIWGGCIALFCTLTVGLINFYKLNEIEFYNSILISAMTFQKLSLACFYTGAFFILYNIIFFQGLLKWFVPIGKMGLTNYIMQSFFLAAFYALSPSILTKIGLTASIGITTIFFVAQVLFSIWWMSLFKYGPIEWIWRSLVYFKWQPIIIDNRSNKDA